MSKPRRTVPATELRVHLGEALRALEHEDLVIEKGGVPVAVLTTYAAASGPATAESLYDRAVSKRAEPGGLERMELALSAGWVGIDADEWIERVYRERDEGVGLSRYYSLDEEGDLHADERDVSGGQRRVYRRPVPATRVADEPDTTYRA